MTCGNVAAKALDAMMFWANATARCIGTGWGPKSISVVRLARPFQQPMIRAASSKPISPVSSAIWDWKVSAIAAFSTRRIMTL